MTTGYRIIEPEDLYFITLQVVDWIDAFTRQTYRDVIIDNLRYCQQNKGLTIFAYVIMSNHVHLLVHSQTGDLSGTLRDFKSYTSKIILDQIQNGNESRKEWMLNLFAQAASKHKRNSHYQFWTHENHAENIYSNKFIDQKLDYIHNNPVKAGLVSSPEAYLYSSASNYACIESLLEVEVITLGSA